MTIYKLYNKFHTSVERVQSELSEMEDCLREVESQLDFCNLYYHELKGSEYLPREEYEEASGTKEKALSVIWEELYSHVARIEDAFELSVESLKAKLDDLIEISKKSMENQK